EATSGRTSTTGRQRRMSNAPGSNVESEYPTGGADFTSSAAPAGMGSNTPVGGEADRVRGWGSHQDAPREGGSSMMSGMPGMPSMATLGSLAATAAIGGLGYAWWRRRQAQQTKMARLQAALMAYGGTAGGELPRMIGQAAAQSKSAWLPLL